MWKKVFPSAVAALGLFVLPLLAHGHGDHHGDSESGGHHEAGEEHGAPHEEFASLGEAWEAVMAARNAIAEDIASGDLGEIHEHAESLSARIGEVVEHAEDLDVEKRQRIEGYARGVEKVTFGIHDAADRGDEKRVHQRLARLDGLLKLMAAQFPAGP